MVGKSAWVVTAATTILVFNAATASTVPCPAPINITAMNAVLKSDLTLRVRVGNEFSPNHFNGRFLSVYKGAVGTGRIVVKGGTATSCGNHLNNSTTYLLFGNRESIRNEPVVGFVGEIPVFTPLGPDVVGEAIEFGSLPSVERGRLAKFDLANPSCIEDDCQFVPFPDTGPGDCPVGTILESSSFACRFSNGSCSWHQVDMCGTAPMTNQPTVAPVSSPTRAPTDLEQPTQFPTRLRSSLPTSSPADASTDYPSQNPSQYPFHSPDIDCPEGQYYDSLIRNKCVNHCTMKTYSCYLHDEKQHFLPSPKRTCVDGLLGGNQCGLVVDKDLCEGRCSRIEVCTKTISEGYRCACGGSTTRPSPDAPCVQQCDSMNYYTRGCSSGYYCRETADGPLCSAKYEAYDDDCRGCPDKQYCSYYLNGSSGYFCQ